MTRPAITDLNPAFLARNRAEIERQLRPRTIRAEPAPDLPQATQKKRIRQRQGDGMNKWERAYLARLESVWRHVHREVSLPLANGLRYKVDFLCARDLDDGGFSIEGHEVKGRARSTGIAKIKMAASVYPWIRFFLATKNKRAASGWDIERVLP